MYFETSRECSKIFLKFTSKSDLICRRNLRLEIEEVFLRQVKNKMENRDNEIKTSDTALLLFVAAVVWLVVFQSGIFR
jgi:hypothetical protein